MITNSSFYRIWAHRCLPNENVIQVIQACEQFVNGEMIRATKDKVHMLKFYMQDNSSTVLESEV